MSSWEVQLPAKEVVISSEPHVPPDHGVVGRFELRKSTPAMSGGYAATTYRDRTVR